MDGTMFGTNQRGRAARFDVTMNEVDKIFVRAFDYASSYDLKPAKVIAQREGALKVLEHNPLLIQFDQLKMVAVFDYGSIVFFGFDKQACKTFMEKLAPAAMRANKIVNEDEFVLHLASRQKKPEGTEELYIQGLNRDIALVVGTVLSRSVSVEYYERLVETVLSQIEEPISSLQSTGKIPRRDRELTKRVGLALSVELELAHTLSIFDDPSIVWDGGKSIEVLYSNLKREFDLDDRMKIIQQKISIVSRSTTFLISRLEALRSRILEWIIIILILSEILLVIFSKVS